MHSLPRLCSSCRLGIKIQRTKGRLTPLVAKVTPVGLLMWSTRLSMGPCMAVAELEQPITPPLCTASLLLLVSMISPSQAFAEKCRSACTDTKIGNGQAESTAQGKTAGWRVKKGLHTFPVAACCAMKPRKATMARRPFLISLS